MSLARGDISVNDIVFAKVRGYCSWPSVIEKIDGNHAVIRFFSRFQEW